MCGVLSGVSGVCVCRGLYGVWCMSGVCMCVCECMYGVYGVCVRNVFGILCECCVYGCGVYVSGVCVCDVWLTGVWVCMECEVYV